MRRHRAIERGEEQADQSLRMPGVLSVECLIAAVSVSLMVDFQPAAAHYFDLAEEGDHPALAAEAAAKGAPEGFSGENYPKRRYAGELMDFARQVGLDRYASARVGEAYTRSCASRRAAGPTR